jgi:hypothetical protein
MPVELMRRPLPADDPAQSAPAARYPGLEDDWSNVNCCSAMRPRPQDQRPAAQPVPIYNADAEFFGQ